MNELDGIYLLKHSSIRISRNDMIIYIDPFQIDIANDRYGYGVADDMGLKKISCKHCPYNSGKCNDCIFEHSIECPL